MLTLEDVSELIGLKTENKNLDYKETFSWDSNHKDEKLEIVKDILAMANTKDGGVLIFGVRDADFVLVGLNQEGYEQADPTKINDLVRKYSDPKIACNLYKFVVNEKKTIAIEVPEFTEEPIICCKNANSSLDSSKVILQAGQIYIRTEKPSSEQISSHEESRQLLGRALKKKREQLLSDFNAVLTGSTRLESADFREQYSEFHIGTQDYLKEQIGGYLKGMGYYETIAHPVQFMARRLEKLADVTTSLREGQVVLRGWDFPHIDKTNASNFDKGRQSFTVHEHFVEGHRAYENGYFHGVKVFWEDVLSKSQDNRRVKSFNGTIYEITEIMLFLKRFFGSFLEDGDVYFRITLNGVKERVLVALDPLISFYGPYICRDEPITYEDTLSVPELVASHQDVAIRIVKKIYALFNWDDFKDEMILDWQTKLIQRRL